MVTNNFDRMNLSPKHNVFIFFKIIHNIHKRAKQRFKNIIQKHHFNLTAKSNNETLLHLIIINKIKSTNKTEKTTNTPAL